MGVDVADLMTPEPSRRLERIDQVLELSDVDQTQLHGMGKDFFKRQYRKPMILKRVVEVPNLSLIHI